jgi:RNA polymerase sigma-70 factor, ECF subfamily
MGTPPVSEDQFLKAYLPVQGNVRAYLRVLLRDPADWDDVFQEVSIALWKQFALYDPARPFLPWVLGVARNHVARWRRSRSRNQITFSPAVEAAVVKTFEELEDELANRRGALRVCLEHLGEHARSLLRLRYEESRSLQEIAALHQKSINAVNKSLGKIRRALLDCTSRLQRQQV